MNAPVAPSRDHRQDDAHGIVLGALVAIVAVGLILRLAAGLHQPAIIDEAFSFLGAQMVAQRGIPLLPSGVLYLHGTIHSYLVAPLLAAGIGGFDDYVPLRLVSAAAGAAAVVLTFRLARCVGGGVAASLLAAALVAIDPASVLWGGHLRMYALAQAFAVGVALLFVRAIADGSEASTPDTPRTRAAWGLVVVFWLAVYTHLATALLLPAMAVVAVVGVGRDLLRGHRDLLVALALCALAPLSLIILTGAVGPGAGTALEGRSEGLPGFSFLGEDNVNLVQVLQPDPSPWTSLFAAGPLALVVPLLLAVASGLLVGRWLLAPGAAGTGPDRRSVGALLGLYWVPILVLAMFATDAAERYAVFLLPSGFVLLALAAEALVTNAPGRWRPDWAAAGGVVLAIAVLLHAAVGAARQASPDYGGRDRSDFVASVAGYVADRHQPGQLILTSRPIETALALGSPPELRYLPGGEGSQRALRYTRLTANGRAIDYWMGMPSLSTTAALCAALRESPGSWVIIGDRTWDNWGYTDLPPRQMERAAEEMRQLVSGVADLDRDGGETMIFRTRPAEAWSEDTAAACARSDKSPGRGDRQPRPDARGSQATPSG